MKDLTRPADSLGEALHFLRMSGVFYCLSELSAPWAIELPPFERCLSFHAVTSGRSWLSVEGVDDRRLEAGDLALVPHGRRHCLSSEPGIPPTRVEALPHEHVNDRYAILRHGGGGPRTMLVCGAVRRDHPAAQYLVLASRGSSTFTPRARRRWNGSRARSVLWRPSRRSSAPEERRS